MNLIIISMMMESTFVSSTVLVVVLEASYSNFDLKNEDAEHIITLCAPSILSFLHKM